MCEVAPLPEHPDYLVSRCGRVFSTLPKGPRPSGRSAIRELSYSLDRHGSTRYRTVAIQHGGRSHRIKVARLVLSVFGPPRPSPLHEIRHLDGNSANDGMDNLAWGTHQENMADKVKHGTSWRGTRNPKAKLSGEQVAIIRNKLAAGQSQTAVAKEFGVTQACISSIRRGKTRSAA